MSNPAIAALRYRFGEYELDCAAQCVRKNGTRVKLQPIPYHTLQAFLERPGQLITREELQKRLWPQGTFVDFEQGLNVAIKKLRDALCDSVDSPRFIETAPGQGYRWIAEVEIVPGAEAALRISGETAAEPWSNRESATAADATLSRSRQLQVWTIAGALLTVATAGFFAWRALRHPAPVLGGPGWVLITNFENRTGQAVLDGSLEYALERELSNSRFVKVASRERIEDALRLMKRPVNSRIDATLGREICLRDGEIQVLITGRVEKIGTNYVLSAELRNAATDVVAAGFAEEGAADKQLADAVRRLSTRVREKLGEDPQLIQPSNAKLERVTTPSLRALQLYSEADRSIADEKPTEAEPLLREAIKIDPDFASGYMLLAYAIRNQGSDAKLSRPAADWKPVADRAFQLSENVPERERYFIRGSYYEMVSDRKKAIANYELLVKLYPDDFWGTSNLAQLVRDVARYHALVSHAADLRPKNLHWAVWAWNNALSDGDQPAIEKYYNRAKELAGPETLGDPNANPNDITIFFAGVVRQLALNDTQAAHAELDRVENQFHAFGQKWEKSFAAYFGMVHLYLGELRSAEKWFELANEEDREDGLEQIAYERRRSRGVPRMKKIPLDPILVARFASDGDSTAAALAEQGPLFCRECGNNFWQPLFRADAEASSGKYAEGIAGLREQLARTDSADGTMCAATLLARHLEAKGDMQGAAAALELLNVKQDLPLTYASGWAADTRYHLAQLYRKIGRSTDAERTEAYLQKQLKFADADHPIILALQARDSRAVANTK